MSEWHGSGLPPSAAARVERTRESGFRFSQLGVASQLAVESCGLKPVATVVGCTARRLDWGEFGLGEVGCGYVSARALRSTNVQSSSYYSAGSTSQALARRDSLGLVSDAQLTSQLMAGRMGRVGLTAGAASSAYVVYVDASRVGWETAIDRMLQEADGLGADGVVSAELVEQRAKGDIREFVVTGTAVRSRGSAHLGHPFATTLSGVDVAKLMAAGWMPASIVLGLSIAIRHDTFRARLARTRVTSAREMTGISELVHAARKHARQQLEVRTKAAGAGGAVLSSQMTLTLEERKINPAHYDIVAEARATATAIVEFGHSRAERPASTPVMPLTN